MGIPNPLSKDFGDDEAGGSRKQLWKPIATCFCSSCGTRDQYEPSFNKGDDEWK